MKAKNLLAKLKRLRLPNYLRELSVVIIGIAVTLYASGIISDNKEKKDLELQLNAIYTELDENLRRIDEILEYHNEHERLRNYLFTVFDEPEKYDPDTIFKYDNVLSTIPDFAYKKGAFDMFVYSGAMRLLSNRTQLLEITDCYAALDEFKHANDLHFALKSEIFGETYRMDPNLIFKKGYDFRNPAWNTKLNFHAFNNGMAESALKVKEQLEEVLSKQGYTKD